MKRKFHTRMIVGTTILLLVSLASLCMGQFSVSVPDVFRILFRQSTISHNAEIVVWNVRIPRILLSLICGAGLAVAGASFQALFSNPLATPDTLGCANGASFGAALGILLGFNAFGVQVSALMAGILAVLLVFVLTGKRGYQNSLMMVILGGMVISSLFSALVSLVKYVADPSDVLPVITFWLMGSFSGATMKNLMTGGPFILIGTGILFLMRYRLNVLTLPEDEARTMGVNVRRDRFLVIFCSSLITASIVSMCGVIGWVGLLIPHICRMLFGNNNSRVIPGCIVFGALFMTCVDMVARCASSAEIPVSILTSVIGAPVFLFLLRKTGGIRV